MTAVLTSAKEIAALIPDGALLALPPEYAPCSMEGIRALVVDKDRAPKWTPASLQGVSDDMVRQLSAPMDTELGLPVPARD